MDRGIGPALRRARERHGVPLSEVAAQLDVHPSFLEAIEQGRIEQEASPVIAKAHVRVYARFLGFDAESILEGKPVGEPAVGAPVTGLASAGWTSMGAVESTDEIAAQAAPARPAPAAPAAPSPPRPESPTRAPRSTAEPSKTPRRTPQQSWQRRLEEPDEPPMEDLGDEEDGRRRLRALLVIVALLIAGGIITGIALGLPL